jgi:hypothetical protein
MTLAGRKRSHSDFTAPTNQPRKRQCINEPHPSQRAGIVTARASGSAAASIRLLSNPQATLCRIPAELRLQFYSYLNDASIIHVHHHGSKAGYASRFTWTPCRSPNPVSPLLCLNPKWSGMCNEEDRCTYKINAPPEPRGFWALAASNKFFRNEIQEFFLHKTVVSIHPQDLRPWLDYIREKNPDRIDSLRRITLAGPNTFQYFNNIAFQELRDQIPNLESIGIQCQDIRRRWTRFDANNLVTVDPQAWKRWNMIDLVQGFDPSITIVLEAMVWVKPYRHYMRVNPPVEQQLAIRVIREGKVANDGSGSGWADEDVDFEIIKPGNLHSCKRTAKWRQWWRGKDVQRFA